MSDARPGRAPSDGSPAGRAQTGRAQSGRAPSGLKEESPARRPPRPVMVELATALLVVDGAISFLTSVESMVALGSRGELTPIIAVLFVVLGIGTVAVGIALRYGRWWLFGVNYIAIAAFLELTSGTPQGLLYGALEVFAVVVLLVNRPWFAWTPDDAEPDPAD